MFLRKLIYLNGNSDIMDKDILTKSSEAAELEFEKEPMDEYYSRKIIGSISRSRVRHILKELNDIRGKRIVDVGCEAGYISLQLWKCGAEVIAFDICKPALMAFTGKLTESNNRDISPFLAIAQKMPIKDESVDGVVCSELIEHTPYPELVFNEIFRILKPGGKLVITFPNENLRKKFYPFLKIFGIDTGIERYVTLYSYKPEDVVKLVNKNFKVLKTYSIPRMLPLTHLIVCQSPHGK